MTFLQWKNEVPENDHQLLGEVLLVPLLCMSTGCLPKVNAFTAQPSERNSIANAQPPGDSEMPGWFVPVYVQATKT